MSWKQQDASGPEWLAWADVDLSAVSVDLDAANPAEVVADAAEFGVVAREVAPARGHGWPTFRYTGTLRAVLHWLAEAYDDGSGERAHELLGRYLRPEVDA